MEPFKRLNTFSQLKILADPRRLAILKQLMSAPATLSQLGRSLGEEPSWIRHHLKILEAANLIELVDVKISAGYIEKYYQSKARAFMLQEILLPEVHGKKMVVLSGSHDLALEILAGSSGDELEVISLPVGSLDGLVALRQGMCNATGCHLYDSLSGEFNSTYVRYFFPDQAMVLITLAYREQGLIVQEGNPHHIRGLDDLTKDLRFINRNSGSGTRIWLDKKLDELGIAPSKINGYLIEAHTHTEVAQAINRGQVEVGLGIHAAASAYHLGFIPLFQERFDLVFHKETLDNRQFLPLFDTLYSGKFKHTVENLAGYNFSHLGDQIIL